MKLYCHLCGIEYHVPDTEDKKPEKCLWCGLSLEETGRGNWVYKSIHVGVKK